MTYYWGISAPNLSMSFIQKDRIHIITVNYSMLFTFQNKYHRNIRGKLCKYAPEFWRYNRGGIVADIFRAAINIGLILSNALNAARVVMEMWYYVVGVLSSEIL